LKVLPLSTGARALIEKKFVSILKQTLEEVRTSCREVDMLDTVSASGSGSEEEKKQRKPSKKRKHTGELVGSSSYQNDNLPDLMDAIFSVMDVVIASTKPTTSTSEEGINSSFSAEYMKTVIRTAAEEAAVVLGSWISLCQTALKIRDPDTEHLQSWIAPFIEIWNSHTAEAEETSLILFSRHCTPPILSLLRAVKDRKSSKVDWAPQLEQLISRNIMNPAKAAKWENPDSDLLSRLTKLSVLQDTANTSQLFEVAIRSIQPHGSRRRRPNDDTWLQTVFKTLKDAMPASNAASNRRAVGALLQCAIDHKLGLDLADLQIMTSEYALPEGRDGWELLATIIKLDANVFLIPNEEQDLLKELLDRITKTSIEDSWTQVSDQVVSEVLVPLMGDFAKARDLSGFLRHWLVQLIEFDRLQKEARRFDMGFGAWEDDALQSQLSKLLEPSLTLQQITQILDWLSFEVTEHPDAVCILLEAIAGSIHHEEVVDTVGLRLYRIMFDNGVSDKLDDRYKWRSWRILSRSLDWLMAPDVGELAKLWGQVPRVKPFKSLLSKGLSSVIGNASPLEKLEVVRFLCAAWNSAGKDSPMEASCKPFTLNVLRQLAQEMKWRTGELNGGEDLGSEVCGSTHNVLEPGLGWTTWSSAKFMFVDYPKIIE
jgi:nucleolar pre-ribosomal-associated protein 2